VKSYPIILTTNFSFLLGAE